jgi:hypothetical protein
MNIQIIKFLFLRDLSEKYELAYQTLKSQDITIEEMILRLINIKSCLREPELELTNKTRAK